MNVKPLSSLSISTGPVDAPVEEPVAILRLRRRDGVATFGQRYVFGTIDQKQLTLQTRVNWILNPRSSLQVYMQPLLSTGQVRRIQGAGRAAHLYVSSLWKRGILSVLRHRRAVLHGRSRRAWPIVRPLRSTIPTSTSNRCGERHLPLGIPARLDALRRMDRSSGEDDAYPGRLPCPARSDAAILSAAQTTCFW